MQVNMTIENKGLIAAEEVTITFGDHPMYIFTPLVDTVGTLPAKSSIVVPITIERLDYVAPSATGSGICRIPAHVSYKLICENNQWKWVPVQVDGIDWPCPGDVDCDGEVGILDFFALLAAWGPQPGPHPADFDGDGQVGILDFFTMLANWGVCP